MSDRLQKFATFLTWLIRIAGGIAAFIGKHAEVESLAAQAAGAYSSTADYSADVADAGNWQLGGLVTFAVSFILPKVFEFLGSKFGGNMKPGWNAALDGSALHTLKRITRVGNVDDMVHIDALIASGVKLETQARIDGEV